jgi:hypothetical protein
MKSKSIIYILFITAALGTGISANSQDQKKPSERSFTSEISKIKKIQADRTKLIEQTKTQTAENTTTVDTRPVNNEKQPSVNAQSTQATKPSSGQLRKPQKPVSTKG